MIKYSIMTHLIIHGVKGSLQYKSADRRGGATRVLIYLCHHVTSNSRAQGVAPYNNLNICSSASFFLIYLNKMVMNGEYRVNSFSLILGPTRPYPIQSISASPKMLLCLHSFNLILGNRLFCAVVQV